MHLRWLAFLVLALPLVQSAPDTPCGPQGVEDDAGDVVVWPGAEPPAGVETGPLDLVRLRLDLEDDVLVYEAELVTAPPRDETAERYRYWFGFEVRGDGEPMYMDLRLHDGPAYESASVIAPNEHGNARLDRAFAHWDGATVRFEVPMQVLRQGLSLPDLTVGNPSASTDGPHRVPVAQGPQGAPFAAPYMVDRAGGHHGFSPVHPCEAPAEAETEAADPQVGRRSVTPLVAVGLGGLAVGAVATGLLGRRP